MTGIRSQVFTVASQAPYYWAIAVHRCTSLYIAVHTIFVNGPEPWVQPPTASNTFSDGFVSFNVIISAYRAANHGNPGNQRTYTYMYDFFSTGLRRKSTNTCITVIPIHVSLKLWLYDASRGFRGGVSDRLRFHRGHCDMFSTWNFDQISYTDSHKSTVKI